MVPLATLAVISVMMNVYLFALIAKGRRLDHEEAIGMIREVVGEVLRPANEAPDGR